MKQLLTILISVLFLTACGDQADTSTINENRHGTDSGTSLAEARAQGHAELTVLFAEAQGFAAHNDAGEVIGVTADIMREFKQWFERYNAVTVNLNFELVEDWREFYQRIVEAEGGVFGLGNVTITEARKEQLQFSPPYMNNLAVLITQNGITPLENIQEANDDFKNLTPLAFEGTLHEDRVRALHRQWNLSQAVATAHTNPEIITKVSDGGYFAYIDAYNYWRALEKGAPLKHHPVANDSSEQFGIIMPHSNDWAAMFAGFFAANGEFTNTQRYRDIMEYHLGEELAHILINADKPATN